MSLTKPQIQHEIDWYNDQISQLEEMIRTWLIQDGSRPEVLNEATSLSEELSGEYQTHRAIFRLSDGLAFSLEPHGIWIVGARGRVEIKGPAGEESLVYLFAGGPGLSVSESVGDDVHASGYWSDFGQKEEGWHWLDDAIRGDIPRFDKRVFSIILQRIQ